MISRSPTVKVSRNGNACTLGVPAPIAESEHIAPGDEYVVEAIGGGDLLYRKRDQSSQGYFVGTGVDRAFVLGQRDAWPAAADPILDSAIDWNF